MKFPRTPHLPSSPGVTRDDRIMLNPDTQWAHKYVVITEKMDGENTTMTRESVHARSLDSGYHPSRTWVKRKWAEHAQRIPLGWQVVGENLYAQHSLCYSYLPDYFLVFAIIDGQGDVKSWSDTVTWAHALGFKMVPWLQRAYFDSVRVEKDSKRWHSSCGASMEGYVIRTAEAFSLSEWENNVAKWVRKGHVQTDEHWLYQEVVKNGLLRE